jgi:hypothetical protein
MYRGEKANKSVLFCLIACLGLWDHFNRGTFEAYEGGV